MKIKRDGIEIELTDAEMIEIYDEQKRRYQIEDIKHRIEELIEDNEDDDLVCVDGKHRKVATLKEAMEDNELLVEVADELENSLNWNDGYLETYWTIAEYAIAKVVEEE